MVEEKQFEGLKYLVSYPEDFDAARKYSLVIYLHGAGTRSENTDILRGNNGFCNLQKRQNKGYVLLAPLCRAGDWNAFMQTLIALVDAARGWEFIDKKRGYLTGNSMGGYGTWELASLRPDWFAAIMPVCGGGIGWMAKNLVDVPVRAFHGLKDASVDPIESVQMAKVVNKNGGHAEVILFPDLGHACWDRVYTTESNYDWLFSFTTDRDKTQVEQYSGAFYG